jgi:predicted anti-sigma-YlaC factor YlaD
MGVDCQLVWSEISNYLEGDVPPNSRTAIDLHFRECRHCRAVLEGTRNVIQLYGDERMIEAPSGFHHRLQRTLKQKIHPDRRTLTSL